MSGLIMLPLLVAALGYCLWSVVRSAGSADNLAAFLWIAATVIAAIALGGFFTVQPSQGVVLQLFGGYSGTAKNAGLRWANPFLTKKRVSLRVRNFETGHLKVNDHDGNPIEIAAGSVWKVVDTTEATLQVDNYENYVSVQSESALRNLATAYPYDSHDDDKPSLLGHTAQVAEQLQAEIHERLKIAGVEVVEARISHLAYAPEIAAAMLRRQQASAIVAARQKVVEGAVGMVEMALDMLSQKKLIQLDEERKAAMVSNLLVVLCGERAAQPAFNTGTIYQ